MIEIIKRKNCSELVYHSRDFDGYKFIGIHFVSNQTVALLLRSTNQDNMWVISVITSKGISMLPGREFQTILGHLQNSLGHGKMYAFDSLEEFGKWADEVIIGK